MLGTKEEEKTRPNTNDTVEGNKVVDHKPGDWELGAIELVLFNFYINIMLRF